MNSAEKYQGIAIIGDDIEGPCITLYGSGEKRDYDLDHSEGKQPDGRPILGARWLDEAVDSDEIDRLSTDLFNKIVNKI